DGLVFSSIGQVPAAGISSTYMNYTFTDGNPLSGTNYYRLVMVDKQGSAVYSKIVSVTPNNTTDLRLGYVFLHSGKLDIQVYSSKAEKATLLLTDMSGRRIFSTQLMLQQGTTSFTRDIPGLPAGIYNMVLFTSGKPVTKRLFTGNR
nr:T9SS type A sorting domain-containing protein [Ferruginibacter sp.]